jgi:hypothetical protein
MFLIASSFSGSVIDSDVDESAGYSEVDDTEESEIEDPLGGSLYV